MAQRRRTPTLTPSRGTPPRGKKTTGTPKTSTPALNVSAGTPPRGGRVVDPRKKPNPPKKLTVTTGRQKPLRNSRSPFVFEYK